MSLLDKAYKVRNNQIMNTGIIPTKIFVSKQDWDEFSKENEHLACKVECLAPPYNEFLGMRLFRVVEPNCLEVL
jgi:hypothetical protein